jgi:hypothetical protein
VNRSSRKTLAEQKLRFDLRTYWVVETKAATTRPQLVGGLWQCLP